MFCWRKSSVDNADPYNVTASEKVPFGFLFDFFNGHSCRVHMVEFFSLFKGSEKTFHSAVVVVLSDITHVLDYEQLPKNLLVGLACALAFRIAVANNSVICFSILPCLRHSLFAKQLFLVCVHRTGDNFVSVTIHDWRNVKLYYINPLFSIRPNNLSKPFLNGIFWNPT